MADIKATEVIGWTIFAIVAIIVLMIFISFCISMYAKINKNSKEALKRRDIMSHETKQGLINMGNTGIKTTGRVLSKGIGTIPKIINEGQE
jgi:hypothetical protein